jgi:predicted dithiol-disulfide oxidoreductase (DUF899 family)
VEKVVSPGEWEKLRLSLLEKEKEATRLRDALTKERKSLPLVELSKDYTFVDSETGKQVSLTDLFDGRPQLIIYHAMFAPEWENACPSCTMYMDHIPPLEHLASRDVSYAMVSRATPEQIKKYREKMGYTGFQWLSSNLNDFNYDFHVTVDGVKNDTYNYRSAQEWRDRGQPYFGVGEQPGHSVFVKGGDIEKGGVGRGEAGKYYHSYSSYGRGGEPHIGTFSWLDMVPLGRQDGKLKGASGLGFRRRGEYKDEEIGKK